MSNYTFSERYQNNGGRTAFDGDKANVSTAFLLSQHRAILAMQENADLVIFIER